MTKKRMIEILEAAEMDIDTVNYGAFGEICWALISNMRSEEYKVYTTGCFDDLLKLLSDFGFPLPPSQYKMLFPMTAEGDEQCRELIRKRIKEIKENG